MKAKLKPKKCKSCQCAFEPRSSLQKVCSPRCAIDYQKTKDAEKEQKALRRERKVFKDNDKAYQLSLAQKSFNAYIRKRDEKAPCISCGRHHAGQYHAGHYRSVGAARFLRFNEDNCHKQCSVCNNHKSGNIGEYRINLVKKIGLERVEALENCNESKKYTLDEIVEIKNTYREMFKEAT